MWHMSSGKKILTGKFRELFLRGVDKIVFWCFDDAAVDVDELAEFSDCYHKVFASLDPEEQFYAVWHVAEALTSRRAAPGLCQWRESAVYAVFEAIAGEVEIEIDMCRNDKEFAESTHSHDWRRLVSSAEAQLRRESDDWPYVDVHSEDKDDWRFIVLEFLADNILWDRDFLSDSGISDEPPEIAKEKKDMFGIADDYYTETIPPVTGELLAKATAFFRENQKECACRSQPAER